jgi:hypothetical protein
MAVIAALNIYPDGTARHVLILRLNGKPGTAILPRILPEPLLPQTENLIRSKHPREETGNDSFDFEINPARQSSGVFIFLNCDLYPYIVLISPIFQALFT